MKWYQGEIREAVAFSQSKKAIFFVGIFGSDSPSEELEKSLNSDEVQAVVSTEDFVCIRLEADTEQHRLFAAIYANANSPSIYCITDKGIPVEIITTSLTSAELKARLESALKRHREVLGVVPASSPNASVPSVAPSSSTIASSSTADNKTRDNEKQEQSNNSNGGSNSSGEEPSFEEKVRRAKELALARQLQKQKEEEEDRKKREIERREAGKGMAELKRWQDEQEAKKILEERKKDKEEEKQLRQRLREQIAQDRAARNARTNAEFAEQPTSSTSATRISSVTTNTAANFAGQARLQFRLPEGTSQTHAFDPDSTLSHVRQFLKDNKTVPFSDFSIWVAFPRRQFTATEFGSSLRELGLLPSAALLILPMSGLSHGGRGGSGGSSLWALIAALLGYVVYPLTIAWSYFQRALPSPSIDSTKPTATNSQTQSFTSGQEKKDDKSSDSLRKGNKLGRGDGNNGSNQPSTPSASSGSSSASSSANNDNQSQATMSKEKGKNSSSQSKSLDGNVHRLRTTESDSDDEKATWNGNSTQQM